MKDLTIKTTPCAFEIKQTPDEDFVHIEGLASTFGNIDRDGDIIAKGAFTNTLTKRKPKLLNQHRMDQPIGVIDSAFETEEGLLIKARMPKDNSMVKDMLPLLKMGALGDFSIGFNTVDADTTPDGNRIIKEVDLWEVSIVTIPANPEAKITRVKKIDDENTISLEKAEQINTKRDFEQLLKDTGAFTNKAATVLASRFNEISEEGDLPNDESKQRDSANKELLLKAMENLKNSLIKKD